MLSFAFRFLLHMSYLCFVGFLLFVCLLLLFSYQRYVLTRFWEIQLHHFLSGILETTEDLSIIKRWHIVTYTGFSSTPCCKIISLTILSLIVPPKFFIFQSKFFLCCVEHFTSSQLWFSNSYTQPCQILRINFWLSSDENIASLQSYKNWTQGN